MKEPIAREMSREEMEGHLRALPGVRRAFDPGECRLCAYIALHGRDLLKPEELQALAPSNDQEQAR